MLLLLLACKAGLEANDRPLADGAAPSCKADLTWDGRRCTFDWASDYRALTQGVRQIESAGALPSALVVRGERAFPVVLDEGLRPFVAAERVGAGRRVHWGHDGYLDDLLTGGGDAEQLVLNAVAWALQGDADPVIGVHPSLSTLAERLSAHGYEVRRVDASGLAGVDVYATRTNDALPQAQIEALSAFLQGGGGVLSAGQAWWWASQHGGATALEFPGNQMFPGTGLLLSRETVSAGSDAVTEAPPSPLLHAEHALDRMLDHVQGVAPLTLDDQRAAAGTVGLALSALPLAAWDYAERARGLAEAIGHVSPNAEAPLVPAEQPIEGLGARLDDYFARSLAPEALSAHPAAADFPGAAPADAERISVIRTITASYEGRDPRYISSAAWADVWRSLGVYAPPGELLTVTLPASAAGQGLSLRIGSHTDGLWSMERIERFPSLTRVYPLDAQTTTVASAFGGLVYVQVPAGLALDLGPFFLAWGWPVSSAALDEAGSWPSWAEDPMTP